MNRQWRGRVMNWVREQILESDSQSWISALPLISRVTMGRSLSNMLSLNFLICKVYIGRALSGWHNAHGPPDWTLLQASCHPKTPAPSALPLLSFLAAVSLHPVSFHSLSMLAIGTGFPHGHCAQSPVGHQNPHALCVFTCLRAHLGPTCISSCTPEGCFQPPTKYRAALDWESLLTSLLCNSLKDTFCRMVWNSPLGRRASLLCLSFLGILP